MSTRSSAIGARRAFELRAFRRTGKVALVRVVDGRRHSAHPPFSPDRLHFAFCILNYEATRPIGIGCMRLSTERDRDDGDAAIAVLHAAFDAGVTFLDTADAYCLDDSEIGHNERLIARALATWNGDRSRIVVATKGGLTRPEGKWIPDGRARHLRAACEASLRALGADRIDLYQLHAPDPRTPLATSVRALAALKDEGLIERVGLCNVNVGQIEEARRITEISAVQVELSVWHDENLLNGVVAVLHHARHPADCLSAAWRIAAAAPAASRSGADATWRRAMAATPAEIALAWLADLSDTIVLDPGPDAESRPCDRSFARTSIALERRGPRRVSTRGSRRARVFASTLRRGVPASLDPPTRDGEVVLDHGTARRGQEHARPQRSWSRDMRG